jgi:hypothetical protein
MPLHEHNIDNSSSGFTGIISMVIDSTEEVKSPSNRNRNMQREAQ